MSSQQIHYRHTNDTRTLLYATLKQTNESGVETVVNLTGLTVKFKMVNAADGTTEIAETATGVTVETAASGTVKYDFTAANVGTAGKYWGYFTVYNSTETDHFPRQCGGLEIRIDSDTQTWKEAFDAAVAA